MTKILVPTAVAAQKNLDVKLKNTNFVEKNYSVEKLGMRE